MSVANLGSRLGQRPGTSLRWGLFALALYLLALVLTLPAQRVVGWTKLPLTEVQGTLWHGSASLAVAGEEIENLGWRLHPVWPWQGVLGASVQAEHQKLQAEGVVALRWNGMLRLSDAALSGPLDSPLIARRIPVALAGQAHLTIGRADWHKGLEQAQDVALDIRNSQIRLGQPIAIGDLSATLQITDGKLEGSLRDHGGPLELSGSLAGNARAGVAFEARLKARPNAPAALGENLRLLPGLPDGSARLQTRVPAPWLATAPTN